MTRDSARERTQAQPEAALALRLLCGRREKHRDGVPGECPRCHQEIVLQTKVDKGAPDYTVTIRHATAPLATVVEVKEGGHRFAYSKVKPEQWTYLEQWEKDTESGTAWFWLMMGAGDVDDKDEKRRRRTFLVTRSALARLFEALLEVGSKSIPINASAATKRERAFDAESVLRRYALEWRGKKLWWPPKQHPFWMAYNLSYREPGNY